jgi:hypothetical protein
VACLLKPSLRRCAGSASCLCATCCQVLRLLCSPANKCPAFLFGAAFYAFSEEDLAQGINIPNAVIGLKSHIVPTGK